MELLKVGVLSFLLYYNTNVVKDKDTSFRQLSFMDVV